MDNASLCSLDHTRKVTLNFKCLLKRKIDNRGAYLQGTSQDEGMEDTANQESLLQVSNGLENTMEWFHLQENFNYNWMGCPEKFPISPDQIPLVTSTQPSSQPASMSTPCSNSEYAEETKINPPFTQIRAVRPHCEQATTVLGDKWYI